MKVFCLDRFKQELERLEGNQNHQGILQETVSYFFNKSISDLIDDTRLNNSGPVPYIKKRVLGNKYRFYFLLVTERKKLYLMYVHSDTEQHGLNNIDDDFKATLYKELLDSIKSKNIFEVKNDDANNRLVFSKVKEKSGN